MFGDPLPAALAARPWDEKRKLPIPWVNEFVDADGDVRVEFVGINAERALDCGQYRLCGVCGRELDYWIAFLGGPRASELRTYGDPPMHEACAEAALTLCPHIAIQQHQRAPEHRVAADLHTPDGWVETKPERWVLGLTRGFETRLIKGSPIFFAAPFRRVRIFGYDADGRIQEIGP